jgi:alpha-galactosidase
LNIDSGWAGKPDQFGRPTANHRFPEGIAAVADHLHKQGQKLGIYIVPGVSDELIKLNPPIEGTSLHIDDIVARPLRFANAFKAQRAIDFSKPGAQAFIDSIAKQFARWGVDLVKLDGIVPGSEIKDESIDGRPDADAWAAAIKKLDRPMWLTLSWRLDPHESARWRRDARAFRIDDDVETYSKTLTGWRQIASRFDDVPKWADIAGPGTGWMDLDSLDVASGELDGITADEKKSAVSFWALCCSPLYVGGDLTKLDDACLKLLTNDELIAVDQAGCPAKQIAGGRTPVWMTTAADGSVVVGMFDLTDKPATVSITADQSKLHGPVSVHDLWDKIDAAAPSGTVSADLPPHGCRVVRLTKRPG